MCQRSVTNLNSLFFFGTHEIGDTHFGFDVSLSMDPSKSKLDISVFKKASSLVENLPVGNSKLLISPSSGNLTPCHIQFNTEAPSEIQFSLLLRKLFFIIHVSNKVSSKISLGSFTISMILPALYPYSDGVDP